MTLHVDELKELESSKLVVGIPLKVIDSLVEGISLCQYFILHGIPNEDTDALSSYFSQKEILSGHRITTEKKDNYTNFKFKMYGGEVQNA